MDGKRLSPVTAHCSRNIVGNMTLGSLVSCVVVVRVSQRGRLNGRRRRDKRDLCHSDRANFLPHHEVCNSMSRATMQVLILEGYRIWHCIAAELRHKWLQKEVACEQWLSTWERVDKVCHVRVHAQ